MSLASRRSLVGHARQVLATQIWGGRLIRRHGGVAYIINWLGVFLAAFFGIMCELFKRGPRASPMFRLARWLKFMIPADALHHLAAVCVCVCVLIRFGPVPCVLAADPLHHIVPCLPSLPVSV